MTVDKGKGKAVDAIDVDEGEELGSDDEQYVIHVLLVNVYSPRAVTILSTP